MISCDECNTVTDDKAILCPVCGGHQLRPVEPLPAGDAGPGRGVPEGFDDGGEGEDLARELRGRLKEGER